MNSIVVDPVELDTDVEKEVPNTGEATSANDFAMPEKFTGKSAEEVAESYTELEKELGRKNNEVGELRKLTDQYLHQELSRSTSEDPKSKESSTIEFDDLVDNTDEVLNKVVDQKLKAVNQRLEAAEATRKAEKFLIENKDYGEISQSQEFYNWVNASPYRARQLMAAQVNDYDAAEDLLQGYRETVTAKTEMAKQEEEAKRGNDLQNAGSETAGTGASSDQVYSRTKLMAMYINQPDKYEAMRAEIEQAYAEGRVKS